jgi:chromosome segregation ATPase
MLQTMLKETKKDIAEFIREIFDQKDQQVIKEYVQVAETLPQVRADIKQMKFQIQRKVHHMNELTNQISNKEQLFHKLKKNLVVVKEQVKNICEPDYESLRKVEDKNLTVNSRLAEEELMTDVLKNMIGRDRENLDFLQNPMAKLKKNHQEINLAIKQLSGLNQHFS